MSKRNQQEDSGSTESLENITSESESEQNYSDDIEEQEQEFPLRGRPNKNRYTHGNMNNHSNINFLPPNSMPNSSMPNSSMPNNMNVPHPTNNMLYRNVYNPGLPPNYRNVQFPSHLGPSNPSFIGNMPQYSNNPHAMRNGPYPFPMGYPPTSYGYPQYNQGHAYYNRQPPLPYGRPPYGYMGMYPNLQYKSSYSDMPGYGVIKRQPPAMRQPPRHTPPLPARIDRERRREERLRKRKKEEESEQLPDLIESEELEEAEIDTNEKLLFCKNDYFFVKTRGFSYLHCVWVRREDITRTRAGSIKVKRFLSSNKRLMQTKGSGSNQGDSIGTNQNSSNQNSGTNQGDSIGNKGSSATAKGNSEQVGTTKGNSSNQGNGATAEGNSSNQGNSGTTKVVSEPVDTSNLISDTSNNGISDNNNGEQNSPETKTIDDLILIEDESKKETLLDKLNERHIQQVIQDDFKGVPPFDPQFIKIDRIISVDTQYLVKWKGIPYELSTLEYPEDIRDLEGYTEQMEEYRKRNIKKRCRYPIDWRPSKESLTVTNTFKNGNTLRDYQLDGLNWLLNRWFYRQGCIMADEMGLGKTVQSVCFVNKLFQTGYYFPVLIVAPLSTLIHWEREFRNWTDLRVLLYHGNNIARELIHDYEFDNNGLLFDVLITTYEMVMSGIKHLDISFGVGIFDEAHRLKNSNSKAFQVLMTLQFNHKVLLSGTPLQNNLTELWSLLHFLDPVKNESLNYFLESYKLEKSEDVDRLKTLLKPVMLRRMKDDVEKIPIKEETIVEVELTLIQKQFYRAILEKNMSIFESRQPNLLNVMMELRKCCIHPYLVRGAEEKILHDYKLRKKIESIKRSGRVSPLKGHIAKGSQVSDNCNSDNYSMGDNCNSDTTTNTTNISTNTIRTNPITTNSASAVTTNPITTNTIRTNPVTTNTTKTNPVTTNISTTQAMDQGIDQEEDTPWCRAVYSDEMSIDEYYRVLIQSSGKLVLLDKLLEKLKGRHKVLIFSQMTRCLDLLAEYLNYKKYKYERIDGAVRGDCRQAAIDRFSRKDSDSFVFLLCTRAGGMGINLTSADTCVIFDSDWNPQNDLQAQARCHRIGQTKNVKIYRLITRNTYEREMFDKAGLKLGLDQAILQKNIKGIKKKEYIESLLKKGAWGVLMENDNEAQKFCEEDIDIMLKRRTQVIRHEEGQNVFSRASFHVEEEFDDPDFWRNLISRKKNAENEQKIKKIIRRLGREERTDYKEIEHVLSTTNDEMLMIFLTIYKKGLGAMFDDVDDLKKKITFIVRRCYDLVQDKEKELFKFHLEAYFKDEYVRSPEDKQTKQAVTGKQSETGKINGKQSVTGKLNGKQSETGKVNSSIPEDQIDKKEKHPLSQQNTLKSSSNTLNSTKLDSTKCDSTNSTKLDSYVLDHPIVNKLAERFLLRLQAVNILRYLHRMDSLELMKGVSLDEDRRIINWVLSNGYDNWPTGVGEKKSLFKGKDRNDLNTRVRKIILALNKMTENQKEREHEHEIDNLIMNYGRVTPLNETDLAEHIEEINKKVEIATTQKRKRSLYGNLNKRIGLMDALQFLVIGEIKRTTGLPRSWKMVNDEQLVSLVRSKGIANTGKELKLTDEVVVRRLEALVSHQNEME